LRGGWRAGSCGGFRDIWGGRVEAQQGGVGVGEVEGLGVEGEFGFEGADDRFWAKEAVGLVGELQEGVGDALVS
jgi:hypothetical protein